MKIRKGGKGEQYFAAILRIRVQNFAGLKILQFQTNWINQYWFMFSFILCFVLKLMEYFFIHPLTVVTVRILKDLLNFCLSILGNLILLEQSLENNFLIHIKNNLEEKIPLRHLGLCCKLKKFTSSHDVTNIIDE